MHTTKNQLKNCAVESYDSIYVLLQTIPHVYISFFFIMADLTYVLVLFNLVFLPLCGHNASTITKVALDSIFIPLA